MKTLLKTLIVALVLVGASGCGRNVRTARDVTPGNEGETKLDWRYGANDIRIQTSKINKQLVDRWYAKTGYRMERNDRRPRIIFTEFDNRTDMFVPTDMIRDIIEGVAINDGRYTIVVGDSHDKKEIDSLLTELVTDPKYSRTSRPQLGEALAPQFLAKMRITKAATEQPRYIIEDYRMTITLYDIETGEAIDSAWDVLRKEVQQR